MKTTLSSVYSLARAAGYNELGKTAYRAAALSLLRSIAKQLALPKESYSIRFNPGGIAVSGDATLHHDRFYLTIGEMGVMWRTCKGQKDYTGGANRWAIGFGESMTVEELTAAIQSVLATPVAV